MVKHEVKCEKWACSTLKAGKNKPVMFITKTRDFKRFCEINKEKSGILRLPIFGLSDKTWTCGLYHPKVARYQLRHTQKFVFFCGWKRAFIQKPNILYQIKTEKSIDLAKLFWKNVIFFEVFVLTEIWTRICEIKSLLSFVAELFFFCFIVGRTALDFY